MKSDNGKADTKSHVIGAFFALDFSHSSGATALQVLAGGNMSQGDKSKYTDKQKRKAEHIADSYAEQGKSEEEAERIAWATVNKEDGGGNQSGSGRKKSDDS